MNTIRIGTLLFVAAAAAPAQDVVVLRDGARLAGRLTSCQPNLCQFAGQSIERARIAWIGLGGPNDPNDSNDPSHPNVPTPKARAGAQDQAHLATGEVLSGRFEGISLGVVLFGEREIDRTDVRWIQFAGAAGPATPETDVLIRRDGALRAGELQGCAGATCTMGNQATARADLMWIGLGVGAEEDPPAVPADPGEDTVELAGGSLHAGRLVGVGGQEVVTQHSRFKRAEVNWIYLAPEKPSGGPAAFGASETPPPDRAPPVEPPRPPPPPPPKS